MATHEFPLLDHITAVIKGRGRVHLHTIYSGVKRIARFTGRELPPEFEAAIRSTLQSYCLTSKKEPKLGNLFVMYGDGECEYVPPTIDDLL
jgi:hypothetical protein